MNILKLDDSKKYLIGLSGGPDSIALTDLVKDKLDIECVHINYNARESSIIDETLCREYCDKNNIKLHVINANINSGNFQEEARLFRYNEFSKFNVDAVLIGHHLDDLIETYMLQKERGIVEFYGLKEETTIEGIKVIRPLLGVYKNDLINYLNENSIPYAIDPSNESDAYKRNAMRKELALMSDVEKNNVRRAIIKDNLELEDATEKAAMAYMMNYKDGWLNEKLFSEKEDIVFRVLYLYLKGQKYNPKKINKKIINEIISFTNKTKKSKAKINLNDDFVFAKDNNKYRLEKTYG